VKGDFFPLFILIIVWLASLFAPSRRWLREKRRFIFGLVISAVFLFAFWLSFLQYRAWQVNALAKYLLPPYQAIGYFVFYALTHFFAGYLLSLAVAFIFLWATQGLNRRFGERFFETEEPYLGALAIFLVGHPGWLVYLASIIFLYLLFHFGYFWRQRKFDRLPLYHFWLPAAILLLLAKPYFLEQWSWWQLLAF
jgi:hypothetical protein